MSKISGRIEKSGWSWGVVKDAIRVLSGYLNFSWFDRLEELSKTQDIKNEEREYIEAIIDYLFRKGDLLLKQVRALSVAGSQPGHDLHAKITAMEMENQDFARQMTVLRRGAVKSLAEAGYKFGKGLAQTDLWLDELWQILAARNAAPNQPIYEENLNAPVTAREIECIRALQDYVAEVGWHGVPLGEREESLLCFCQHFYTTGAFNTASSFFVDAIESGFHDPLIYYDYFILGLSVGEFEAAMEGYRMATQALPMLSLAPSERYQIESVISKERIGINFAGKDNVEKQAVLLKVLYNPPQSVRKAILEVRKKIKHTGIAEIYDFHEINKQRPCIAMERLEGPTLAERVEKKGRIPAEEWLQLALQITGALAYAHDQGIVHGNLNPSKLYMHKGEIKIVDFGMAPLDQWPVYIGRKDLSDLYFFAPELLASGSSQLTSDVYSLGKTLYYLLTGKVPHLMYQENVPGVIWPILRKATETDPQMRHKNATEFLADLAQASASPISLPAQPKAQDIPSGVSRNRIIPLEDGGTALLPEKFFYRDGTIYSQLDDTQMILVAEGNFTMGAEERASESPVHEVFLSHYLIDKYLVTNAQYSRFLDYIQKSGDHSKCHAEEPHRKDHTPKGWGSGEYKKYSDQDNCPVIFIDYWDALAYAAWAGKALPTEAQWEKAARGNDGRKYPWGDEEISPELANWGNNLGKTSVVGSFPKGASPYGCMDMAGDVWQWCLDTYDKDFYRISPHENPLCSASRPARVLRGGSWNDAASSLRTPSRGCWVQTVRYAYIGFRCVRML